MMLQIHPVKQTQPALSPALNHMTQKGSAAKIDLQIRRLRNGDRVPRRGLEKVCGGTWYQ
jgi:hypothetical protein